MAGPILAFLLLGTTLLAQQPRLLIVNDQNMGPATVQDNGRTYVDAEIVTHVLNGSLTLHPDRVILTIPSSNGSCASEASAPPEETISRQFASSALAAVAMMRDWKVAIETMISLQLPVTGTYFQDFQYRAEQSLRQAGVVGSTTQDRHSYQLLQDAFSRLAEWAGNAIARRQALNATRTMSPDVLKNDEELQQITECGTRLGAMLVSLYFEDIPACH